MNALHRGQENRKATSSGSSSFGLSHESSSSSLPANNADRSNFSNNTYGSTPNSPHSSEDSFLATFIDEEDSPQATVVDATVNLVKLCIGSGVLALPYAVDKGGLILSPIFIGLVAWWNYVSCEQMMDCKAAVVGVLCPRQVNSTYSRIAYCACGWWGVWITDMCIIVTLLGVCVTYLITFTSLMSSIPFVDMSNVQLCFIGMIVVYPLAIQKDVSKLAKMSILGLLCVLIGIASITFFGLELYGELALEEPRILPLWCPSIEDFATFVGIAVFGFGTCSLAFPVEESMKIPKEFPTAAKYSLIFVWLVYVFVGNGIASLFIHDSRGIASNILRNLPLDATSAHIVKGTLAISCILTMPLAFIPPASMIESMLVQVYDRICGRESSIAVKQVSTDRGYTPIKGGSSSEYTDFETERVPISITHHLSRSGSPSLIQYSIGEDGRLEYMLNPREPSNILRYINRSLLIALIAIASLSIPCFGLMISLLGAFTVAILSFVLPPLFSLIIISQQYRSDGTRNIWKYNRDIILLLLGIFTTISATSIVALQCYKSMSNGGQC